VKRVPKGAPVAVAAVPVVAAVAPVITTDEETAAEPAAVPVPQAPPEHPVRQVQAVQPAPPAQVVMTKNQVEDAVEDVAEDVAEVGVVVGAHQARRKVPVFRMVLKAVSEYTDRLCNLTGRLAVKGKPLKC
jgi:hypothetical protein